MSETTMRDEDPRTERIRLLVEECLDRYEKEGQSAIDAVCQAHPDLAEAIRKRVHTLESMGLLEANANPEIPERLGEFRILRKLGAGGMGVVYLAEQESLKRQVALKLVRPEHLFFDGAKERFRREAEAVARLQHPSIVPVLTVGEQDGVPFYAMEYIEGCSLAEALMPLKERPPDELDGSDLAEAVRAHLKSEDEPPDFGQSWVNACLRVAESIADALSHAHERGVLHRDIKPSNIMLARDGRVLLLDFGLATVAGSATITRSGSQLGSMLYMAPELIRSDASAADEQSDIYGLGATLYEMLCLQPPHTGESNEQIMLSVVSQIPERVRRRNASVPDDAETVCHNAIELELRDRYATASSFAKDLRNVLELRPIDAIRPGWLGRARRFAKRRPAVALAGTLAAILVIGGPLAYAWMQQRAADELRNAFEKVEAERTRAELYLDKIFEAVERTLLRLGSDTLKDVPRASGRQLEVYEDVLAIFREFEAESAQEERLQVMYADCKRRIAFILTQLERHAEAERAARDAIKSYHALLSSTPDDITLLIALAHAHESLANAIVNQDRSEESIVEWEKSIEIIERARAIEPGNASATIRHGFAAASLGTMYLNANRPEEAMAVLSASRANLLELRSDQAPDPEIELALATVESRAGKAMSALGFAEDATKSLDLAVSYARDAVTLDPAAIQSVVFLGEALSHLGSHLTSKNRTDDALPLLNEALPILGRLSDENPDQATLANHYAACLSIAGFAHRRRGEYAQAIEHLEKALRIRRSLSRRFPEVTHLRISPASTLGSLGESYARNDEPEKATSALIEANSILDEAFDRLPDKIFVWRNKGLNYRSLSQIAMNSGRAKEALEEGLRAILTLRQVADATAEAGEIGNLVFTLLQQCDLELKAGDYRRIEPLAAEMIELAPTSREGSEGAAAMFLQAIAALEADRSSADYATTRDRWIDTIIDRLRVSVSKGYTELGELTESPICDPIRDDPRFTKLLLDLKW